MKHISKHQAVNHNSKSKGVSKVQLMPALYALGATKLKTDQIVALYLRVQEKLKNSVLKLNEKDILKLKEEVQAVAEEKESYKELKEYLLDKLDTELIRIQKDPLKRLSIIAENVNEDDSERRVNLN